MRIGGIYLSGHSNLYYLFLEDQRLHPMPEARVFEIRKNIEKFYEKIKPPWNSKPLNSIRDKDPG